MYLGILAIFKNEEMGRTLITELLCRITKV